MLLEWYRQDDESLISILKTENFSCATGHSRTPFAVHGKETVMYTTIQLYHSIFEFFYLHVHIEWKLEVTVIEGPGIANFHLELVHTLQTFGLDRLSQKDNICHSIITLSQTGATTSFIIEWIEYIF